MKTPSAPTSLPARLALSALAPLLAAAAAAWWFGPSSGRLNFSRLDLFVIVLLLLAAASVAAAAAGSTLFLARALLSGRRPCPRERRSALVRLAAGLALLAAAGWGRWVEPRLLEVERIEIASPRVVAPLRLVVLSDLHSDARFDLDGRVAAEVNALEPDVIIFLGDALNAAGRLPGFRAALSAMRARSAKVAVRGNWDRWFWEELDLFGGTGFQELSEGWRGLEVNGTRLQLGAHAWLDDWDPVAVLGTPPDDGLRLLLYHANDYALEAAAAGVDLYLCGDTHGGQISLPGWGPLFAIGRQGRRFVSGLSRIGGTQVFVTAGIGVEESLPLRFGVRPRISVLELRPQP